MIPELKGIEMVGSERLHNPARRNAAAATPVEKRARSGGRTPVTRREFAENGVPFPPDAFGVSVVVTGEIGVRLPIRFVCGGATEKAGPEPIKGGPVELLPIHRV